MVSFVPRVDIYLINFREEWGYDGAVISDWGAIHDTRRQPNQVSYVEMSITSNFDEYYMANPLLKAVRNGEIKVEYIDKKIRNILRTMLRLNMLGEEQDNRVPGTYNDPEHRKVILECAEKSIIYLKTENILPLNKSKIKTMAVLEKTLGDSMPTEVEVLKLRLYMKYRLF